MQLNSFDSPEKFISVVPRDPAQNVEFRLVLHSLLAKDKPLQNIFSKMCFDYPQIYFDTCCWTYNPQEKCRKKNVPFVLWPHQIPYVNAIKDAIDTRHNLIADKTRKQGGTEILCGMFGLYWRFDPQFACLVGSSKADLVDKGVEVIGGKLVGDHRNLFHKILYSIVNGPQWMKPNFSKTYMHLENYDMATTIDGEATNENFAVGGRYTVVGIDELGAMNIRMAQGIIDKIYDVSECVIYNSSHYYGTGHPYNQLLTGGKIPFVTLAWEDNPNESPGMYRSPDYDEIEIKDIDYYRKKCPEVFNEVEPMVSFKLSSFEKRCLTLPKDVQDKLGGVSFVADGGDFNDGGWRSPWYDEECKRRDYRKRDIAQNIDRNPSGSGDNFFNPVNLKRAKEGTARTPTICGNILYERDKNGKVISWKFVENQRGRLKLWCNLVNGRPRQDHNYIIGADVSRGTGASNSINFIVDANTGVQIGLWADANTPVDTFAETTTAITRWAGGPQKEAYLIWEETGPGESFDFVIRRQGLKFVYITYDETARTRKKKNKYGWRSNPNAKFTLLNELDLALAQGLKTNPVGKSIVIRDLATLIEMGTYVYLADKKIGPLHLEADDETGARAAHGDRTIGAALCVLAMTEQVKAIKKIPRKIPYNCQEQRFRKYRKAKMENQTLRRFLN